MSSRVYAFHHNPSDEFESPPSARHAAILVGGASRRMGRPKAALVHDGRRLIDAAIQLAAPFVDSIFLVGRMPDGVTLESVRAASPLPVSHLADDPTAAGPLAGILAALAHDPRADWLCLSCDMPGLTREAIEWLLSFDGGSIRPTHPTRLEPPLSNCAPRRSAMVAQLPNCESPEPFPAIYHAAALPLLRAYAQSGGASLRGALAAINADVRPVPPHLVPCWLNVNTPADWERFSRA